MSEGNWQFIIVLALSGVVFLYFKYLELTAKLNYLRKQHMNHNNVLINQEKDIAEFKGKMSAAAIDIAGLFIIYGKMLDRIMVIEDKLGIELGDGNEINKET